MAYCESTTKIAFKNTGTEANVPNNPTAKLMYYLNCVSYVLELDDDAEIKRLREYQNYLTLGRLDINCLIQLAKLFPPKDLLNKCFFQSDDLCRDMSNKFYDLESAKTVSLVAGNIEIGGRNRQVKKIMTYTMSWVSDYYETPLDILEKEMVEWFRQEFKRAEYLRTGRRI